ncbi:MAG: phosphoribosylformylglycinamidine synthase II [Nitrospinae bacterium CG11_big_fil_rev_8_21_14_0_20_56_8]|nr:MAG: phosphoribosylformylglycinamidine synthase II [Nitrospinae bacterium CG11_big_fil_rev_8_21_14_0_20_56_8]
MKLSPDVTVNVQIAREHGLTGEEYRRILDLLGRIPNLTELGIFSVMWSEHCSYKSSRPFLSALPTEGPRVIQGPGENAGVVDIGDGLAVVFKIESHNHPSFVEPHQGAATGVGGILRDIFTMGARPIALLDSLRFGDPADPRMRFLLNGVVEGISNYGNCTGVPTVGGEIYFDDCYNGNILVNVFCLGLIKADKVFLGRASGTGNPVIYFGSKTGRDGIHGASLLASAEFDESSEEKRPTVQVGDPFTEKLLIEASLDLMKHPWVVGIQDMGAAGLTSSSFEMASRAGTGIDLDLDQVPRREKGMTPYEIMLSESQERMLVVVEAGHEEEALEIFRKWDLDAAVVGRVTEQPRVRLIEGGDVVADLPVHVVVEGPLSLKRKIRRPNYLDEVDHLNLNDLPEPDRGDAALKRLLSSLNIASKEWVYDQYDHMVRLNTLVLPGSDAAVLRVPGTSKAVAISVDCNSRYCYLDPFNGARIAVAESSRNLACSGAFPIGLTNCLNFGNPEKPEIMWQFEQGVQGIAEACKFLEIPVVSGNVSLYNETRGIGIFPTPTVAVVGLLEDSRKHMTQWFKRTGDFVGLIGLTIEELGGSEYLKVMFEQVCGGVPTLELRAERQAQEFCRELIGKGFIASAHDCSEGGLAVALAECCISGPGQPVGAAIELESTIRRDAFLFGETQSRILISFSGERREEILAAAERSGVDFAVIGRVGGEDLSVTFNGAEFIRTRVEVLRNFWKGALGEYARQVT